jgi:hypothetical protein
MAGNLPQGSSLREDNKANIFTSMRKSGQVQPAGGIANGFSLVGSLRRQQASAEMYNTPCLMMLLLAPITEFGRNAYNFVHMFSTLRKMEE